MKGIVAILMLLTAKVAAQWLVPKPTEFEPLTSLPWEAEDATRDKVLAAIFREPNEVIRYSVLVEYLTTIPPADMVRVFEQCVPLEGTQNPDELVARFIRVWAARDPAGCWNWVKTLFHVVGIENGVLGYDSWSHPRITVQNLEAIRGSPFWITSRALASFPEAISPSALPKAERVQILREFANIWFDAFSSWPRPEPWAGTQSYEGENNPEAIRALIWMLKRPTAPDMLPFVGESNPTASIYEITFRRMLKAYPESAPDIVRRASEKRPLPSSSGNKSYQGPSNELLLIWAKSDLPGMVRWVESLNDNDWQLAYQAKGLLMGLADAATRARWLKEAQATDAGDQREALLFNVWAEWDLEGALKGATKVKNSKSLQELANAAAYGPWPRIGSNEPWNQSRYAFKVLSTFDYSTLPPKMHALVLQDCYSLMEQWDSMDVAAAARFGYAYLRRTTYVPREGLIQFFSGKDIYAGEDGMIDRTFCALRVWAVVRHDDMKKWITTIRDSEMRRALTWLLENPWGTGTEK